MTLGAGQIGFDGAGEQSLVLHILLLRIKVGKFGVSEKAGDTGRMML